MEGNCTHHVTFLLKLSAWRRRTTPQIGCFPGVVASVERSGDGPRGAESRQADGAKWRQPPGAKWRQAYGAKWRRPRGSEVEGRRRRGREEKRAYPAKRNGPTAPNRRGTRRGDAMEQGEATPWNKARRRGGAKWKTHGSVAADRVDAVQHADATKEAALRVQRGGKSVPSPTGSLQGIPSECLQPPLKGSTVRPLPCRRRIAPVNARGPLDVAGPFVAGPFDGCQSFHACAHATGGGASPTLRPAWP